MSQPSILDPDTIRAYLDTDYRVLGAACAPLRIGERNADLAALHAAHGTDCSAFVTACNPLGTLLDEAANAARQSALAARLARGGLRGIEAFGQPRHGDWPGEPSFLVPGLALDAARALGAEFEQNAIVWSGADAVPRLILLR